LLAIGILIAGLSGLCTLVFLVSMASEANAGMLPLVLVVGGLPLMLGLGLVFGGRAMIRKANEEEQS
jgi:hypothetical protein